MYLSNHFEQGLRRSEVTLHMSVVAKRLGRPCTLSPYPGYTISRLGLHMPGHIMLLRRVLPGML